MHVARTGVAVAALSLAVVASAGDLQVLCPPGLRVLLDGAPVGVCSAREDGLFLRGVAEGRHTIRVEGEGVVPQHFEIEVGTAPMELRVAPPQPTPAGGEVVVERPSEAATATVVITSAPQNCTVELAGKTEAKTTPTLRLEGIAAGQHRIVFAKEGYETVSRDIVLYPGVETTVRGDLMAGEVVVGHEGKGSLRLISNPATCTVRIAGRTRDKVRAVLNLTHLPAGPHRLVVSFKARQLTTDVVIRNGQRTVVRVDLLDREAPFAVSYEPE